MYTIIGGDGREYGPASIDQIKAWIASGRANGETRAKLAGTDEWKRLADIPELHEAGGGPPPLAGAVPSGDAEAIAQRMIARTGKLDISSCFERSWALLRSDFWPLLGVTVLFTAMTALGFAGIWCKIAVVLLSGALKGGLYWYFLKKIRGQPARLGDAFIGFQAAFVPLLLASLISSGVSVIGLFLLLIPGIYLIVSYLFIYLLILDQKMDFWTAMEVSRRVVTAQWWRVFGLLLLAILFAILGIALFLVGLLVALPFIEGALVYAYEDLFTAKDGSIT